MTQYEMEQNLENHRFQSAGIIDNIFTIGIANPTLENLVRNSLAKENSASFQMALENGGIYRNNTFLGGHGLYDIVRRIVPKSLRSESSSHYGGIGPIQFNKFSAGVLNPNDGDPKLSEMAKNIADNNPDWNVEDDIVATGFGFQNKGYKEFFDKLNDMGFELNKAKTAYVNLDKDQMKMFNDIKSGKFKSILGDDYKTIYSSPENVKNYINNNVLDKKTQVKYSYLKREFEKAGELENFQKWYEKNAERSLAEIQDMYDGNLHVKDLDTNMSLEDLEVIQKFRDQYTDETGRFDIEKAKSDLNDLTKKNFDKAKQINKEYEDYDSITKIMNDNWNAENLSDDLYNKLNNDFSKIIKDGIDVNDSEQIKSVQGFLDDFFNLEKSFNKFGKRTTSEFNKAYVAKVAELQKKLSIKNINKYAAQNGGKFSAAKLAIEKEVKESLADFIKNNKNNIDDAFRSFGDDVGRHFATKTGLQKFFGNKAMSFLTGIRSGLSAFFGNCL